MERINVEPGDGFQILRGTTRSQAATMVFVPGETTGGPDNVHANSDQWLYVMAGSGEATVGDRVVSLESGTLLLIEAGESHQITNNGTMPLVTLNVYAPPAY